MGKKNRNQGGKGGGQRGGGQRPQQPNRPAAAQPDQAPASPARPQATTAASTGFTGSRAAPVQRVAATASQAAAAAAPKHNVPLFSQLNSADKNLLIVFTGTTLVSALLLFSVQPMFAKMVLPVLGGSPSVWAVAMCFFQGMLLLGYLYAHFLINMVDRKISGFIHIAVCAFAFLFLPIAMPGSWNQPPTGEPYMWQLGLFAVAVGMPFFAVAANAPLLQAWFSQTDHPHRADPYFLYGASNLGSMFALLAYPFVLEPALGVTQLSRVWTYVFVALAVLLGVCFWYVRSVPDKSIAAHTAADNAIPDSPAPSWADRARWVGLALVPSALLTAFTTHVSTDVASAPLLWVIPLALYLLTFVFVFRERPILMVPVGLIVACLVYAVLSILGGRGNGISGGAQSFLALAAGGAFMFLYQQKKIGERDSLLWTHLATIIAALYFVSHTRIGGGWFTSASVGCAAFVASAMVAHRTLFETRPGAKHLTEFYLWLSLGGVLGGIFSGLVAPKIFSEIFEYPLLIALTMACRPGALDFNWREKKDELMVLWLMFAGGLLIVFWLPWLVDRAPELARLPISPFAHWPKPTALVLMFAAVMLYFWRFPQRQLVMAVLMFLSTVLMQSGVRQDGVASRSFFGVYRVSEAGPYNVLVHGTTLHGAQRVRDDQGNPLTPPDLTPTTYYHPNSPMGQSVNIVRDRLEKEGNKAGHYGVIGLGSGSMGCHKKADENWTYFEIDPVMRGITTNPKNFSFVKNCLGDNPNIVMGDARLTMAKQPDGFFDLIVVDAFSSDAVPVHLMTKEALELFKAKLTPKGVAVLHVSNRYLDLDGVLAATQPLVPGFHGVIVTDEHSEGYGASASTAVMFSKDPKSLDGFRQIPKRIQTTETRELAEEQQRKQLRPWTDDWSDIMGPFMARNFPSARQQ